MVDSLREIFWKSDLSTLIAKFLFFIVAVFSLYNSITTAGWGESLLSLVLVLVCGLLIDGGYEDIKFTVMELMGIEVTKSHESKTGKEVRDLLSDRDAGDLTEVDVNETEGTYQLQFERE